MEPVETTKLSQQRIASKKPRGTKLDPKGGVIKLKGSRNYTPYPLSVGPDEMVEDIVRRGLRADGLSTKLGIKNNTKLIAGLVSELLQGDCRHDEAMKNFYQKRQKNNSTKNIFSTMTLEELDHIKNEIYPKDFDIDFKKSLLQGLGDNFGKLESVISVIRDVQHSVEHIAANTESLRQYNFQTRGFFLDVFVKTCSFVTNIIQDSLEHFKKQESHRNVSGNMLINSGDNNKLNSGKNLLGSPTTMVVNGDKVVTMTNNITNCNDHITNINNVNFDQMEKNWMSTFEVVPSHHKQPELQLIVDQRPANNIENSYSYHNMIKSSSETVVVEYECHEANSANSDDSKNRVCSHASTSSVVTLPKHSFTENKLNDESDNVILNLANSPKGYMLNESFNNYYLFSSDGSQFDNDHTLISNEGFIPIEGEMELHQPAMPPTTQEFPPPPPKKHKCNNQLC